MATGDFPWRFATGFEKAGKMNSFAFFFKVMDSPDATPLTGLPTDKLNMINQVGCEPMLPFLARCFERLPANRAKAVDLLQHPWLRRWRERSRDIYNSLLLLFRKVISV
jgi:serine/threonine protein kinase